MTRVVAWNIRHGGGRRVEAIARQIEAWAPDVAVLIEHRRTPPGARLAAAIAAAGLEHQLASSAPADRDNGLLVASREPLRPVRLRTRPPEAGRWLLARVGPGEGALPFVLGAMHVPNRVTGRKYPFLEAVLGLARRWRGGPALFVGDTNSGRIGLDEESPAFNRIEDGWMRALESAGWADAFRALHGAERAYTWYSPNGGNGFRLDQAFVHRSLLPRVREVRHAWGSGAGSGGAGPARRDALSDHAALIVDFDD